MINSGRHLHGLRLGSSYSNQKIGKWQTYEALTRNETIALKFHVADNEP